MLSFISKFSDFTKYFFINISMNPWKTKQTKQTICIPEHLLKNGWILGHVLVLIFQVNTLRRQSVLQGIPPPPPIIAFPDQLRAAASDVIMWLLWSCRPRWSVFVVYCVVWCLHDNIRLGSRASFVFFGAFTLYFLYFYILFEISGLHSLIKIEF